MNDMSADRETCPTCHGTGLVDSYIALSERFLELLYLYRETDSGKEAVEVGREMRDIVWKMKRLGAINSPRPERDMPPPGRPDRVG